MGGLCLLLVPRQGSRTAACLLLLATAICIQLRLVCNLLDGLMAVEAGKKTKTGEIFNEFPDRIADVVLFVCAGYSVSYLTNAIALGWACGVTAVLTAYIRVFGGSVGLAQDFCGPMAKQQRMAVLTAACVLTILQIAFDRSANLLFWALAIILAGSVVTAIRRTYRIAILLNQR